MKLWKFWRVMSSSQSLFVEHLSWKHANVCKIQRLGKMCFQLTLLLVPLKLQPRKYAFDAHPRMYICMLYRKNLFLYFFLRGFHSVLKENEGICSVVSVIKRKYFLHSCQLPAVSSPHQFASFFFSKLFIPFYFFHFISFQWIFFFQSVLCCERRWIRNRLNRVTERGNQIILIDFNISWCCVVKVVVLYWDFHCEFEI